jgi:predicted DCC family thiol-disulfide oxidoreductase YuxK
METSAPRPAGEPVSVATPVVLFDGVCNLCNGTVRFIILHDTRRVFRFAPLQSATGQQLLAAYGIDASRLDTFVLVEGDRCLVRSDAVLAIARHLAFPWSLLVIFRFIPRPVRDWMYGIVARNRYSWFGERNECLIPSADVRARFLGES